jgi:hypothetical protein
MVSRKPREAEEIPAFTVHIEYPVIKNSVIIIAE